MLDYVTHQESYCFARNKVNRKRQEKRKARPPKWKQHTDYRHPMHSGYLYYIDGTKNKTDQARPL